MNTSEQSIFGGGQSLKGKHKSRCLQKGKFVNWGGGGAQACRLGRTGLSGPDINSHGRVVWSVCLGSCKPGFDSESGQT